MGTNGVGYFPLDCSLDTNFQLVEAEYGIKGFAIIVKIFQRIYGGQGYYCEWNNEVALLFSRQIGEGCNVVSEVVNKAIDRGIFDKEKFTKYGILTSLEIQKRYFEIVKRRKNVKAQREYLLVSYTHLNENVCISDENVYINGKNVDINEQRKVKESKGNKSKENKEPIGSSPAL